MQALESRTVEDLEIQLLLDGVYFLYGYDLRDYAANSLKRRLRRFLAEEKLDSVSRLQERVLRDPISLDRLLDALFINVTSMFRDPDFYLTFRKQVVPYLRTYPFIRIWHAGCSTGEEVYSMAILLEEEGIYDRSRIYATDINGTVVKRARNGVFRRTSMEDQASNYLKAGGKVAFSGYFTAREDQFAINPSLKKNIVFAQHNLATDASFNEFNAILCRNVIIYFKRPLQERVHRLLYQSLGLFGFLGLGNRETVKFTPHEASYDHLDGRQKLYRKLG